MITRRELLRLFGLGSAGSIVLATPWLSGSLDARTTTGLEPPPTLPPPEVALTGAPNVADLAADLDWDVDRIFRFVADEVAYEPYAGALRGATGAMWAKAGNSADQALLLAALLAEAQVPHRLVKGTLDAGRLGELLAGASMDLAAARTHGAKVLLTPAIAQAWTGEGLWSRHPDVAMLLATARDQITASAALVAGAIADAGLELPQAAPSVPDAEMVSHYWVQYADGPDWFDLDPTLPAPQPRSANATESIPIDEIPDSEYHAVTIRLVADVVTGGVPTRTELASRRVRSADVVGEPVLIIHAPAEWLGVGVAITGEQQYVPMVIVGEDVLHGTPITLTSGEGVLDAFGEEAGPEGQALAEWLEVDVEIPGIEPRRVSRVIFDRVPAEQRAAGTIDVAELADIELTELDELGPVFLPFAGPRLISIAGQPVPAALFQAEIEDLDPAPLAKGAAHTFYAARQACQLSALADLGHRFYLDEPTVLTLSMVPGQASASGDVALGLDLLHSHQGAIPLAGAAAPAGASAGILAGAVDHAAERLSVESPFSLPDAPPVAGATAGRIFELAAEQHIAVVVARSAADVDALDAPAAARQYLREAIDAGRVLVVPAGPVDVDGEPRLGWWELDLATGRVNDRLDNGGGTGEYTVPLESMWKATTCFRALAGLIFGVARGVTGVLDGYSSVTPILLAVQLAGGAACGASL